MAATLPFVAPSGVSSHVRELINHFTASLCGKPPNQRLPYEALSRCTLVRPPESERERELLSQHCRLLCQDADQRSSVFVQG